MDPEKQIEANARHRSNSRTDQERFPKPSVALAHVRAPEGWPALVMNRNALFIASECYNNRSSQRSFYGNCNSQEAAEDSPGSVGEGIGAASGEVERCTQ